MTELYVFRGTAGKAEMVTDDKSGKKLPPHSFGKWVFSRTIVVASETRLVGGVERAPEPALAVQEQTQREGRRSRSHIRHGGDGFR